MTKTWRSSVSYSRLKLKANMMIRVLPNKRTLKLRIKKNSKTE